MLIKTTRNKRSGGLYLTNFYELQKLGIQCKNGIYFSFDFGWYSFHLDVVH